VSWLLRIFSTRATTGTRGTRCLLVQEQDSDRRHPSKVLSAHTHFRHLGWACLTLLKISTVRVFCVWGGVRVCVCMCVCVCARVLVSVCAYARVCALYNICRWMLVCKHAGGWYYRYTSTSRYNSRAASARRANGRKISNRHPETVGRGSHIHVASRAYLDSPKTFGCMCHGRWAGSAAGVCVYVCCNVRIDVFMFVCMCRYVCVYIYIAVLSLYM